MVYVPTHHTFVGSNWDAAAVRNLRASSPQDREIQSLHWDKGEEGASVGSVRTARACPHSGFTSGLLGVTGFAAGLQPGSAETSCTFKSFPSRPRCLSFSFLSLLLCLQLGLPPEMENQRCRKPLAPASPSPLLALVGRLVGDPGGG